MGGEKVDIAFQELNAALRTDAFGLRHQPFSNI
jgi:hypothetical protein